MTTDDESKDYVARRRRLRVNGWRKMKGCDWYVHEEFPGAVSFPQADAIEQIREDAAARLGGQRTFERAGFLVDFEDGRAVVTPDALE